MRPRDTLTPELKRELEAMDRVLADEPVEYDLRELEDLVRDIRATAPEMSPGFAARLEHEVAEGFPTPREEPSRLRRPPRRWVLLPAAGSLAAVVVAVVVVLGGSGDQAAIQTSAAPAKTEEATSAADSAGAGSSSGGGAVAADEVASAPAQSTPAPAARNSALPPPASSASSGAVVQAAKRRVERNAALTLETPDGRFEETTDQVNIVVARFRGIVASSQIGTSEGAGGEATFDLRIPTDRLDEALAALAKLGHVTERSQSLDDITSSFTSAQERLTDARAERRGLLRALERATTQQQIDSLKAQLRSVGSRINGLKSQLASLNRRANLATVNLTVRGGGEESGATTGGGGHWTPGDAAGDAVRVLEVLAGVTLIGLAVLLPAGLVAAAVGFGVRFGRRRRREAALDPA